MEISHIDHVVLTVKDIEKTVAFYVTVLGMRKEVFGEGRVALCFGSQKINLHTLEKSVEPKAHAPLPGALDFCLIIQTNLNAAMAHVRSCGVEIIEGPVKRTGARGPILSFYFRDPDQNLIELAHYV